MKILVLGITGRTGKLIASEALKRGHEVVGIARNLTFVEKNGVTLFQGSPMDETIIFEAIKGCDAVVSTLNISRTSDNPWAKLRAPKDLMSISITNVLKAMIENGIKRIVIMTAMGVGDSKKEMPGIFNFLVKISNMKYAYSDHDRQEKLIESSTADWTIVRPVMLTNKNDDLDVLVNRNGIPRLKASISRNAVANFILDCIEKNIHLNEKIGVSGQ